MNRATGQLFLGGAAAGLAGLAAWYRLPRVAKVSASVAARCLLPPLCEKCGIALPDLDGRAAQWLLKWLEGRILKGK